MPIFEYIARDNNGILRKGILEAETERDLIGTLQNKGIFITSVRLSGAKSAGGKKKINLNFNLLKPKVKSQDVMVFSRQFAAMMTAGISLTECLEILGEQCENVTLKDVISRIRVDVENGKSLADALSAHPKIFDRLYVSMIEAAQTSGGYDIILSRLATSQEKEDAIKRKVKSALISPLITIGMALIVAAGLVRFVVPQFAGMFADFGGKLPKATQMLVDLSNQIGSWKGTVGFATIIICVLAFRQYIHTKKGRYLWDSFKLKMPLFGPIIMKSIVARFARIFSMLESGGVPMLETLEIVRKTADNVAISKVFKKAQEAVESGERLAKTLGEANIFPPMVIHMINSGEQVGALSEMLDKIADFYEEEVERSIENLNSVLKPIMTIIMAIIILGVIVPLYLPVFKLPEVMMNSATG